MTVYVHARTERLTPLSGAGFALASGTSAQLLLGRRTLARMADGGGGGGEDSDGVHCVNRTTDVNTFFYRPGGYTLEVG
jgi:hypothetical protein